MKARVNFLRVILALVFAQAPKDNGFNRKRESCTQFSKIRRRNSQLSKNRQTSRQSKEEKVDFQVYRRKTRVKDNQLLYQIRANASSIERTCKNGPFGTLCKSHIFFPRIFNTWISENCSILYGIICVTIDIHHGEISLLRCGTKTLRPQEKSNPWTKRVSFNLS